MLNFIKGLVSPVGTKTALGLRKARGKCVKLLIKQVIKLFDENF